MKGQKFYRLGLEGDLTHIVDDKGRSLCLESWAAYWVSQVKLAPRAAALVSTCERCAAAARYFAKVQRAEGG